MLISIEIIICICTAVCITAEVFYGEENIGNTPFVMKGAWRYWIGGLSLFGMLFNILLAFSFQSKKDIPKPKYEMVDQGHYYKMVPNE